MIEQKKVVEKLRLIDLGIELPDDLDPKAGVNDQIDTLRGKCPLRYAINTGWKDDYRLLEALIKTKDLENGCDLRTTFLDNHHTPITEIFTRAKEITDSKDPCFRILRILTEVKDVYTTVRGPNSEYSLLPLAYLFKQNQKLRSLLEDPIEALEPVTAKLHLAEKILIAGIIPAEVPFVISFLSDESSLLPKSVARLVSDYLPGAEHYKRCQNPVRTDLFTDNLVKLAFACHAELNGPKVPERENPQNANVAQLPLLVEQPQNIPVVASNGATPDHERRIALLEGQVESLQKENKTLIEQNITLAKQMEKIMQLLGVAKPKSNALTFSFNPLRSLRSLFTSVDTAYDLDQDSDMLEKSGKSGLHV